MCPLGVNEERQRNYEIQRFWKFSIFKLKSISCVGNDIANYILKNASNKGHKIKAYLSYSFGFLSFTNSTSSQRLIRGLRAAAYHTDREFYEYLTLILLSLRYSPLLLSRRISVRVVSKLFLHITAQRPQAVSEIVGSPITTTKRRSYLIMQSQFFS